MTIRFTILGEPASKANSRKMWMIGGRTVEIDGKRTRVGGQPRVLKSDKALSYERDALRQIPPLARQRIEGPVFVTLRMFYSSERPDLDESIVLDVLQDRWERPKTRDGEKGERVLVQAGVYRNDRQVRKKLVEHYIDRANPRVEIEIEPMQPQQVALPTVAPITPKTFHAKHRADVTQDKSIPFGTPV